jgi:D-amino-acid dehydrogenase
MSAARTACVVGAGIVGCATAYALARDGWQVTLVDAAASPGQGATLANGAQLSYSYVEPLATPAALASLPRWLLAADSPLRWRPRPEWAHLRWLLAFVLACRQARVLRTTAELLALSFHSREVLHGWLREPALGAAALAAGHVRPGKLVLYRDASQRDAVARQLEHQRALGCRQRVVSAEECRALEPALAATGGGAIAFGVWTEDEEVIDAAKLAAALARHAGPVQWRLGRTASGFVQSAGRVVALKLNDGDEIAADAFVLAAGAGSAGLLRPLGVSLPIEPIKGYSITLPVVQATAAPRASITDSARKLVHARLGDSLRVAGFAELCGSDRAVDARRIEALCQAVRDTFPRACDFSQVHPWAGLRPATPSGRPLVGATRWPNLWINTGHGALGLTLAAGSASLLAALMQGRTPAIDAAPYRL